MFYTIAEALALHSIEMREHVAKEIAAHDAKENARLREENARLSNENAALRADRTINASRNVFGVVRKEANRDVA